jgi:hypothetical protein
VAGNTRLEGKVLMGREYLNRATDYNMRFTGNVDKAVVVTESPMWENLPMTFPEATEWIAGREADFRLAAAGKPIPRDSLRAPLRVIAGDTAVEAGTLADERWLVLGSLRITGSARVERAEIWAESILVGGSAVVRDALLYARDRMVLEGEPDLDGQFLVRDSMKVTMRGRHTGDPVFYVHGSYDNEGYHGHLGLDSADTRGIFLVADYDLPNNLYRPSLEMLHSSRVDGMLYTNSYARIEGIVNGGLVCDTFRYEYKGTIWIGFLKDAHVTGYPAGAIFRGPPLFAGGKGTWMGAYPAAF